MLDHALVQWIHSGARGVLPEKFGGGVQPASRNPYLISDQNVRFSLPYFRPDQKFGSLFQVYFSCCPVNWRNNLRRAFVLSPVDEQVQ